MIERLRKITQSLYVIPAVYLFCFLCQVFNLTEVCICTLAVVVSVILFFAEDPKNIFGIIFYVGFYVKIILEGANWILYGICMGIAVLGFIFFTVKWGRIKKQTLKKGKFFYPLLLCDVGFMLGGILYDFSVVNSLITLATCLVGYLLYFIALNFTEDLKDYLIKIFIFGGILVAMEVLWTNISHGGSVKDILNKSYTWVGSEHMNTAALYMSISAVACFAKGFKTNKDGLYFIFASLFMGMVIITQCRAMMLFGGITYAFLTVYSFIKSDNKRNYLYILICAIVVMIVFAIVFWSKIQPIFIKIMNKNERGLNGRQFLWRECFRLFTENPIFGAGYISKENLPGLSIGAEKFIHVHNTVLQWLTSLGIVGSLMLVWFYIVKYKTVFSKFFSDKFFLSVIILVIELSGMLDQVATCHFIVYMIPIIILSEIEKTDVEKRA